MSLFRCKKCGTQVWNIESQLMQFSQYFKQKYDLDITFKGVDFKHIQYTIKNTIFIDNSQEQWMQIIKNDLKMLIKQKQKTWKDALQYADPINRGRIHPKESDSIAISSRYTISREDIDQNGVINAQPKFISWSLVSKQNFIDKSCVLQPYTCSNCDMNCVIDPSKEWNQQKVVKHIGQQIAKEVDQDIVEELINIKEQK